MLENGSIELLYQSFHFIKHFMYTWLHFCVVVLDLGLHVLNGIGGLNIQSDGLASEGLDEDLHGTAP